MSGGLGSGPGRGEDGPPLLPEAGFLWVLVRSAEVSLRPTPWTGEAAPQCREHGRKGPWEWTDVPPGQSRGCTHMAPTQPGWGARTQFVPPNCAMHGDTHCPFLPPEWCEGEKGVVRW